MVPGLGVDGLAHGAAAVAAGEHLLEELAGLLHAANAVQGVDVPHGVEDVAVALVLRGRQQERVLLGHEVLLHRSALDTHDASMAVSGVALRGDKGHAERRRCMCT